jgi:hypothetical protein
MWSDGRMVLHPRFAIFSMRNFQCVLVTVDQLNGPQSLLNLTPCHFSMCDIKDSVYNKKPANVFQMKEQICVEFANLHMNKKNSVHLSENQCLGDVKCVLNMTDNNLNNFCSSSLSLSAGGCLYIKWVFPEMRVQSW